MAGKCDAQPKARPTILVADDNAEIRMLAREILEECGYRVVEAANGRLAGECLRHEKVDLLMTDIVMPDMEGIETIADARRNFPEMRILAMSGFSQVYLDGAARLGAHGTLRKPFKLDDLRRAVMALVAPGEPDHSLSAVDTSTPG